MHLPWATLALAAAVSASFQENLNYHSPSSRHPELGISLHHVLKRNDPAAAFNISELTFTHGVASGDPYDTSVILWTRVAPTVENDRSNVTVVGTVPIYSHETETYIAASKAPICVDWRIGTTENLTVATSSGRAYTSSDIDYTLKARATL